MKKDYIQYAIIILTALLLIFSVVQAVQIDNLKNNILAGSNSLSAADDESVMAGMHASDSPQKSSPTMVGGC